MNIDCWYAVWVLRTLTQIMRTEKGVDMVELTLRDGRKTAIRASFVVKVVSEVVGGQDCTRLEILGAPYSTYVVEPYTEVVDLIKCYGKI